MELCINELQILKSNSFNISYYKDYNYSIVEKFTLKYQRQAFEDDYPLKFTIKDKTFYSTSGFLFDSDFNVIGRRVILNDLVKKFLILNQLYIERQWVIKMAYYDYFKNIVSKIRVHVSFLSDSLFYGLTEANVNIKDRVTSEEMEEFFLNYIKDTITGGELVADFPSDDITRTEQGEVNEPIPPINEEVVENSPTMFIQIPQPEMREITEVTPMLEIEQTIEQEFDQALAEYVLNGTPNTPEQPTQEMQDLPF